MKINIWYEMANGYDGEVAYIFIYFKDRNYVEYLCFVFNETSGEPYDFTDVSVTVDEFDEIFSEEEMESIKEVNERFIINACFN